MRSFVYGPCPASRTRISETSATCPADKLSRHNGYILTLHPYPSPDPAPNTTPSLSHHPYPYPYPNHNPRSPQYATGAAAVCVPLEQRRVDGDGAPPGVFVRRPRGQALHRLAPRELSRDGIVRQRQPRRSQRCADLLMHTRTDLYTSVSTERLKLQDDLVISSTPRAVVGPRCPQQLEHDPVSVTLNDSFCAWGDPTHRVMGLDPGDHVDWDPDRRGSPHRLGCAPLQPVLRFCSRTIGVMQRHARLRIQTANQASVVLAVGQVAFGGSTVPRWAAEGLGLI